MMRSNAFALDTIVFYAHVQNGDGGEGLDPTTQRRMQGSWARPRRIARPLRTQSAAKGPQLRMSPGARPSGARAKASRAGP
eukprot:1215442-Pyramimonas_sp.AAC.1